MVTSPAVSDKAFGVEFRNQVKKDRTEGEKSTLCPKFSAARLLDRGLRGKLAECE